MERLKALIGKKEDKIEFVRYLINVLLSNREFYSDEILFRDAVEEIYEALRSEVIDKDKKELTNAYELAVLLRAIVRKNIEDPEKLLREIRKEIGG